MSIEISEQSQPVVTEEHFKMLAAKIQNNIPNLLHLISTMKNTIDANLLSENYEKCAENNKPSKIENRTNLERSPTIEEIDEFFKTLDDIESKVKPKFKRPKLPSLSASLKSKTTNRIGASSSSDDAILTTSIFCGSAADITINDQNFNETTSSKSQSFDGAADDDGLFIPLAEKIENFQNFNMEIETIADVMDRDRTLFDTLSKNIAKMQNLFASIENVMANKKEIHGRCFITKEFRDKLALMNEILTSIDFLNENVALYSTKQLEPVILPLHDCIDGLLQKLNYNEYY